MKIALGQMHIRWEDKAANLGRVENWMKLLKEKNMVEILFSSLFLQKGV